MSALLPQPFLDSLGLNFPSEAAKAIIQTFGSFRERCSWLEKVDLSLKPGKEENKTHFRKPTARFTLLQRARRENAKPVIIVF